MITHLTRKISLLLIAVLALGFEAFAQDFSYSTPLVAGRSNEIGEIQVDKVGNSVDVTYVITDPNWTMTKSYLHVTDNSNGFPTTADGIPDIQNFDYQENHANVSTYKYENIDVTGFAYVYVSANANVTQATKCEVDIDYINAQLPTQQLFMQLSLTRNPAYFNMLLYDFGGNLIFYDYFFGNCVDLENPISSGFFYYPYAVSSYSTNTQLLDCIVDKPQNLDLVNFIINQDYKTKFGADGPEIQAAVWTLMDDDTPQNGGSNTGLSWNQSIVDDVITDARAKGEFYVPECDGYFAVLLDQGCTTALQNNTTPNITTQQSIFWLPVNKFPDSYETSTGGCANAWGIGSKFSHTGWGQYFQAEESN